MKISFRIVSALLSVGVIVAAFFAPMFTAQVVALESVSLLPEDAAYSIYDLIELATSADGGSQLINFSEIWQSIISSGDVIKPIVAPAICLVVFFALALLFALAIIIINVIKYMKKTTLFLGLGGLISVIAALISMNALAEPLISGELNIFSALDLGFLLSMATSLVEIADLSFTTGAYLMLFAFIGIFIWGLSNIVIELGDPKPIKERKRK